MSRITIPPYWEKAQRSLMRRDPALGRVIRTFKNETLQSRGRAHYTLARSIVGQQISVKAADAIWLRLETALQNVTPKSLLDADETLLRGCGLSGRKVQYLQGLSSDFAGRLEKFDWHGASDEEVIETLCTIRGIGRWTAEMFLIFHLMRPDVFPLDDIGMRKGVQRLHNHGEKLSLKEIEAIGERWRPWRSVATWYLWRMLDPVAVTY